MTINKLNKKEVNKFLTLAMETPWYEPKPIVDEVTFLTYGCESQSNKNFYTWEHFGILYEWATDQKWFSDFSWHIECPDDRHATSWVIRVVDIHPERLAESIYLYLKDRENDTN